MRMHFKFGVCALSAELHCLRLVLQSCCPGSLPTPTPSHITPFREDILYDQHISRRRLIRAASAHTHRAASDTYMYAENCQRVACAIAVGDVHAARGGTWHDGTQAMHSIGAQAGSNLRSGMRMPRHWLATLSLSASAVSRWLARRDFEMSFICTRVRPPSQPCCICMQLQL